MSLGVDTGVRLSLNGASQPTTSVGPQIASMGALDDTTFQIGLPQTITPGTATATGDGTVSYEMRHTANGVTVSTTAAHTHGPQSDGALGACQWRAVETGGSNDGATPWITLATGSIRHIVPQIVETLPDVTASRGGDVQIITTGPAFAGQALSFALSPPLSGLSIDPATGDITLEPGIMDVQTATPLTVSASNSGGSASVEFALSIEAALPAAPTATGALADQVFTENTGLQSLATAGDFTGTGLSYALSTAPSGVTIDAGTGVVQFDTDTMDVQAGSSVVVQASNAGGSASSGFSLTLEALQTVQTLTDPATGAQFVIDGANDSGTYAGQSQFYVVPSSGTTVTLNQAPTPAFTTNTNGDRMNGLRVNPAYDEGTQCWHEGADDPNVPFNAALMPTFPLTLNVGDRLVMLVGKDVPATEAYRRSGLGEGWVSVHVVASAPANPATTLGPGIFSSDTAVHTIDVASWVTANANSWDGVPAGEGLSYADAMSVLEGLFLWANARITKFTGYEVLNPTMAWPFVPPANAALNYGRYISENLSIIAVMLDSDEWTNAQKANVITLLAQCGKQADLSLRQGGFTGNGAHNQAHIYPVLLYYGLTGQTAKLADFMAEIPGNLSQAFTITPAEWDDWDTTRSTDLTKPMWAFERTLSAISGTTVTLSVHSSGSEGDSIHADFGGCTLVGLTSGATGLVPSEHGSLNGSTFDITLSNVTGTFQVGEKTRFNTPSGYRAVDWNQRPNFPNVFLPTSRVGYRFLQRWGAQLIVAREQGLLGTDESQFATPLEYLRLTNEGIYPTALDGYTPPSGDMTYSAADRRSGAKDYVTAFLPPATTGEPPATSPTATNVTLTTPVETRTAPTRDLGNRNPIWPAFDGAVEGDQYLFFTAWFDDFQSSSSGISRMDARNDTDAIAELADFIEASTRDGGRARGVYAGTRTASGTETSVMSVTPSRTNMGALFEWALASDVTLTGLISGTGGGTVTLENVPAGSTIVAAALAYGTTSQTLTWPDLTEEGRYADTIAGNNVIMASAAGVATDGGSVTVDAIGAERMVVIAVPPA